LVAEHEAGGRMGAELPSEPGLSSGHAVADCNGVSTGLPVADLDRLAPALVGKVVSVRGPLGLEGGLQTMKMCSTEEGEISGGCCNSSSSSVIVGAPPDA